MAKSESQEAHDLWDTFSKQGELFKTLESELLDLIGSIKIEDTTEVFLKGTTQFTPEFSESLDSKLSEIFVRYSGIEKDVIQRKHEEFIAHFTHDLDRRINKKALCEIEFESYAFYKFIKAFSERYTETLFQIENDHIAIRVMDDARITLVQLIIADHTYHCYKTGQVSFNLEDLEKLLKASTRDKSTTQLIIGEEGIFLTITSEKYHSTIERKLDAIDLDAQDVPLDTLFEIQYPFRIGLSREQFEYVVANLGKTNELANILCLEDKIEFSEDLFAIHDYATLTQKANRSNAITFKKKHIAFIEYDTEILKDGYTQEEEAEAQEMESHLFAISTYSTIFLGIVKNMVSTLAPKGVITFSVKYDHPLRIDIDFQHLGKTAITYFMAPRVPEAAPDDEEFEF